MAHASRQSSYLLGSVGVTLQVLGGWWYVSLHLPFRWVDPWWNSARLTLYLGIVIVSIAVWRGLRVQGPELPGFVNPIRFVNVSGLKLAGIGSVMQMIDGIWNEIVHRVFLSEPKVAPAHALLTLGMLTVSVGMIIGLSVEYGMIRREILILSAWRRRATFACMVLVFASIWLTTAGALVYAARVLRGDPYGWTLAVILSMVGTLILVPAKRVLPEFGSVTLIGIVSNSVIYFFLVVYAEVPIYVPWGLIPPVLYDVFVVGLKRVMKFMHAVVLSSTVFGVLFYAAYFPFTQYLFPWSIAPQVSFAFIVFASLAGALMGQRVFSKISSLVLGNLA